MSRIDSIRADLARAGAELAAGDLPALIGVLESAKAAAWARLTVPTTLPATNTPMVTAEQIADHFGVPVTQIYSYARQRRLPAVRLGKYVRFSLDQVREALANEARGSETHSISSSKKRNNRKGFLGPATAEPPANRRA